MSAVDCRCLKIGEGWSCPIPTILCFPQECNRRKTSLHYYIRFVAANSAKNLPAMQETLAWEDPLEEGMATHSSIIAWRIPWTGEPGGLQFMGHKSQTRLRD